MKKLILLIIPLIFLIACSNTNIDKKESTDLSSKNIKKSIYNVNDFITYKSNTETYYINSNSSGPDKFIYVDIIKDDRIQLRIITGDSQIGEILETKNGELKLISAIKGYTYFTDMTQVQNLNAEILLKEPIAKGTSWTLPDGSKRYISNINVKVSTSHNVYTNAIEVTTQNGNQKSYAYYVPYVGLVKTTQNNKNKENSFIFSTLKENTSYKQNIKFFYPRLNTSTINYVNKKVTIKTNQNVKDIFTDSFRTSPNSKLNCLLAKNVEINNIEYDNNNEAVSIDLSNDFISEMNKLDYNYEKNILQCVTDTLSNYYGTDKVRITIENKPYSSNNIQTKDNEYFYISKEKIHEFK